MDLSKKYNLIHNYESITDAEGTLANGDNITVFESPDYKKPKRPRKKTLLERIPIIGSHFEPECDHYWICHFGSPYAVQKQPGDCAICGKRAFINPDKFNEIDNLVIYG